MSGPDFIARLAPWPEADFSAFGETDAKPLTKIQQLTSAFLGRNWVAIPHVTHHDLADITGLETRRQAYNKAHPEQKLTPPVLIAKALVAALARANGGRRKSQNQGAFHPGDVRRLHHHQLAWPHRRHRLHAHHQRAGTRHPRCRPHPVATRAWARWQHFLAPDVAAIAQLRSPRDQWRRRRTLHPLHRRSAGQRSDL